MRALKMRWNLCVNWRLGGTAVGTGSIHQKVMMYWLQKILPISQASIYNCSNKFEALAAHDAMVELSRRIENGRSMLDENRQ